MFHLRSRRGQVRGIDFSLSMVIFLLIMSQVLILTGNFIAVNRNYQSSQQRSAFVDSTARDLLLSDGWAAAGDWLGVTSANIALATDWEFGLSTAGEVNPFKLGRLSNWSINSMLLDYNTTKSGLNLGSKKYSITITSTIDVNITSVRSVGTWATVEVNGSVSLNNANLDNAYVQLFTIDTTSSQISESFTLTNINGSFSNQMTITGGVGLADTTLTVVAIAKSGTSAMGVSVFKQIIGAPAAIGVGEISVFESTVNSAGYSVRVQSSRVHDGAIVTAFYVGSSTGSVNFTQNIAVAGTDLAANPIWDTDDLAVPGSGMVVFVTHETLGGAVQNENILTFPAVLDDQLSNTVKPVTAPTSLSAIVSLTFTVRDVLMIIEVVVWE